MNEKKKSNKIVILVAVVLVALLATFAIIMAVTKPKAQEGSKNIKIEVIIEGEETKTFDISTDAEFLGEALVENGIAEGADAEFGMFLTTVNGRVANESEREFWSISKNGVDLMTGVDMEAISDGDKYELTLLTW